MRVCGILVYSALALFAAGHEENAGAVAVGPAGDLSMTASMAQQDQPCEVYLEDSLICGAGRGVFLGSDCPEGFVLDASSVNVPVLRSDLTDSQLDNYVFDTGQGDYSMVVLGVGSLLNHMDGEGCTVDHNWVDEEVADAAAVAHLPLSTFTSSSFSLLRPARAGDEVYTSYGEHWLSERGYTSQAVRDNCVLDEERPLPRVRVCVSDVVVDESRIRGAGRGLFARRAYEAGDLVTVAPAAVLALSMLESTTTTSVLWNYCIALRGVKAALLPLGQAAIVNHAPSLCLDPPPGPSHIPCPPSQADVANLRIFWHSPPPQLPLKEVLAAPFAPLDLAYRALRPIAAGEELLLDYGDVWQTKWEAWLVQQHPQQQTLFRQMIAAPSELLVPEEWLSK